MCIEKLKKYKILGLPLSIFIIILLIIFGGIIGIYKEFGKTDWLTISGNFALILTLATIIAYVYYTYLLAKEAWTTSASFGLLRWEKDPYLIIFILQNHSKFSLRCWCKLNASVCGQPVSLGGFYSGESSFDLQPFSVSNGNFKIREIVALAVRTVEELENKASDENIRQQLYLDIEFWYYPVGREKDKVENPKQPHYFDFRNKIFIADV